MDAAVFGQPPHFVVKFTSAWFRRSFHGTGVVAFSDTHLVVSGDLVTKTFLPMVHFFMFFGLITMGNRLAGSTGMCVAAVVSLLVGLGAVVGVQRYLQGVYRTIPYSLMHDVALRGCQLHVTTRQFSPPVVSFRVRPEDCERLRHEVEKRFPAVAMQQQLAMHRR